jgi:nitrogen fixation protein NifX
VVYGVKADRVTLLRVVEFPVVSGHQRSGTRSARTPTCSSWRKTASPIATQNRVTQSSREIQLSWYEKAQRRSARQRDPQRFNRLLEEQTWREGSTNA